MKAIWAMILLTWTLAGVPRAEEPATARVDFGRSVGRFRPLHGINKGPLAPGGLVDVTEGQRALAVPLTRLHDCHWPNPDVVDMHAVFPDPDADPERPESYDFRLTDEYLAAVRATGAQVVYRLGESIEHTSVRRFVHPPKDPERWARAALGVVRHYNEGWAGGFRHGIRYWEVWNEPENRPAMWSGTDDDYFRLYRATARLLKAHDPGLKVGGPAVGDTGQVVDGELKPSAFMLSFLDFCRREKLPLDFFSWHCYTDDPAELAVRARAIRRLLDARGFARTESHLNEWNYLPGKSWEALSRTASAAARERFYARMAGAEGAAFLAAALLGLQDAPVDAACLFHGETDPFGLFSENGVPYRNYGGLQAFRQLLETPQRVEARVSAPDGLTAGAGTSADGRAASVLLACRTNGPSEIRLTLENLPWTGESVYSLWMVDEGRDFTPVRQDTPLGAKPVLVLPLNGPSVVLLTLRPAAGGVGDAR